MKRCSASLFGLHGFWCSPARYVPMVVALALLSGGCKHRQSPPSPPPVAATPQPPPPRAPKNGAPKRDKPPVMAADEASAPIRIVRLFYATDRAADSQGTPVSYGKRPLPLGAPLNLGTCHVTVPPNHVTGRFERPPALLTLLVRENREKHFTLGTVQQIAPTNFWGDLRKRVADSDKREIFVFIHGFNNSFANAAMTAGQLAFDLGFDDDRGAPILYSWCSQGENAGYQADELAVTNTVQRLEEFLYKVARDSGANAVHLLAHSMGNRALTQALHRMSVTRALRVDAPPFQELVLAAPDVDSKDFPSISRTVASTARHASLYFSDRDVPLALSALIHGRWRLGQTGMADGFESLDVSKAIASLTDLLEHSYYHDCQEVVLDLYRLFNCRCQTETRCGNCFKREEVSRWHFAPVPGCRHLSGQP